MPAASRPRRSLLALTLVAGLLAATAPIGLGAVLRSDATAAPLTAPATADTRAADSLVSVVQPVAIDPATVVDGMTLAQREARAEWLLRTRPPTIGPKAVAG